MYEKTIEDLKKEFERIAQLQRDSMKDIEQLNQNSEKPFDLAAIISNTERSISDIDTLTSSLVKFGEGIRPEKNWQFVPRSWIADFSNAVHGTANSYQALREVIASVESQHGGFGSIDPANFSITGKNNTAVDLKRPLETIAANIDAAFENYFQLRTVISAPRFSEFADLFSLIANRRSELDGLSKELTSMSLEGKSLLTTVKDASKLIAASKDEILKFKEGADKDRKGISEIAGESSQRLDSIKAVQKNADELSSTVSGYQATFSQFQKDLDARNKNYETQKQSFETLKKHLENLSTNVAGLISQAEDMLKGATTSGLAASFSAKQHVTNSELKFARAAYYISIALLVFLTLPVFIYSLPRELTLPVIAKIFPFDPKLVVPQETTHDYYQYGIQLLARGIFLIPGLLFVRFASSRHERLFRLREDYAYKYSIASSVDGFKKQAEQYADEIAASAYFALTYNPAERMDPKGEDAKMINPLLERVIAKLEGKLERRAKKAEAQKSVAAPSANPG
jgi:hypothetical protein